MKRKLAHLLIVFSVVLSGTMDAYGQSKGVKELQQKLTGTIDKLKAAKKKGGAQGDDEVQTILNGDIADLVAFALISRSRDEFVQAIEEARVDKQVGGGDTNSGSTNLVSKGSVPAILGFAVENGALKKESSGTTITFRGKPVGIIKALGDQGFIQSYDDDSPAIRPLRRLSFALSFDTQRGDQMGAFVGDLEQLSSYSFRYDIYNKRDPRHSSYRDKWADLIENNGLRITMDTTKLAVYMSPVHPNRDPVFSKWYQELKTAVTSASADNVGQVLKDNLGKLRTLALPPEVDQVAQRFAATVESFLSDRETLLNQVANGSIITFEYTNTRQVNLPDLSNFRLIYENSLGGKADFTANTSLTIFNKKITGSDRLRDFQLSGQFDISLSNPLKSGNFVLSLSGKYQRMMEDTMTNSGMMMDTKGDIGIGQIKLTIPVKGSGVKIPISITFANRTELIKEKQVRGNFGFTLDLDSIFANRNP